MGKTLGPGLASLLREVADAGPIYLKLE